MKKFLMLIASIPLIAASCDLGFGSFDLGSGTRGIFKSEDGGDTFFAANRLAPRNDISGLNVNAIAMDPSNGDIIYIGATNGIFKTEDGARTWRYILSNITVSDFAIDPQDTKIIYASGIAGQNGKIIKSLDGGTTWVDMYTEASRNNAVTTISLHRSSNQTVLAGLFSGQLIRSEDAGKTWQATKDLANRIISVRVSANSTAYALSQTRGLYKSTDAGVTWTAQTEMLISDVLTNPGQALSGVTGFWYIGLDEKQPNVVYLGTDQGLFRSVNDGVTWSFLALPVKSGSLRVSAVSVNPSNSNNIFASIGFTVFESLNGGVSWQTKVLPTNARIRNISINPQSQNIMYLGLTNQ